MIDCYWTGLVFLTEKPKKKLSNLNKKALVIKESKLNMFIKTRFSAEKFPFFRTIESSFSIYFLCEYFSSIEDFSLPALF